MDGGVQTACASWRLSSGTWTPQEQSRGRRGEEGAAPGEVEEAEELQRCASWRRGEREIAAQLGKFYLGQQEEEVGLVRSGKEGGATWGEEPSRSAEARRGGAGGRRARAAEKAAALAAAARGGGCRRPPEGFEHPGSP